MKCIYCKIPLEFFLHKNGYDIYKCPTCGIGQTDLKEPYTSFVKRLYDKEYFTGGKSRTAYTNYAADKPFIVKNFHKFLKAIKQQKQTGKMLDVGCAMGFFVELAIQHGYDAYGIDPSSFAADAAKKLVGSKRIRTGTLDTIDFDKERFDIITLFDVFEHVENPAKILKQVHALLKPEGIIVIATGNTASIWAKVAKKHWTFYIPPQHLFFFNRTNIASLLQQQHFQPLHFGKIGKWLSLEYVLHLAETAAQLPFSVQAQQLAKQLNLHRVPIFLPIGDNMLVIAKKS
jgi:2-polyprenyl-3-methyl-5-hydroxy-6-metoxy-1,4-benzoquinol methylase